MEPLIRPMESVAYELALRITTGMLKTGLISNNEFKEIDRLNKDTFIVRKT